MRTHQQLVYIAKVFIEPIKGTLGFEEEEGFINDLVAFAEYIQNLPETK